TLGGTAISGERTHIDLRGFCGVLCGRLKAVVGSGDLVEAASLWFLDRGVFDASYFVVFDGYGRWGDVAPWGNDVPRDTRFGWLPFCAETAATVGRDLCGCSLVHDERMG